MYGPPPRRKRKVRIAGKVCAYVSIKASVGKSGGGALKAVELTTGGLLHVVETRLEKERFFLNVRQKSAKGIVVRHIGRRPER